MNTKDEQYSSELNHDFDEDLPVITAKVKWYDPTRGYGFLLPDDNSNDVLLHATVLKAAGLEFITEGTELSCTVIQGDRGIQAREITQLDVEAELALQAKNIIPEVNDLPYSGDNYTSGFEDEQVDFSMLLPARIKWFDKQKGFGFVNVFGNPTDVFIHMETLRKHGIIELQTGEAVSILQTEGERGPMVSHIFPWR